MSITITPIKSSSAPSRLHLCWAVANLTAREIARQGATRLIIITTLLIIALLPFVILHQFGEAGKLVRDSALALQYMAGLVLSGFGAHSGLAQAARAHPAQVALSKPLPRTIFFLGNYAGVALVTLGFNALATLATICAARLATSPMPFGLAQVTSLCSAGLLIAFSGLIFAGIFMALPPRLKLAPLLTIGLGLLLLGTLADYLLGAHVAEHSWAAACYAILPNWQHFFRIDALGAGHGISSGYLLGAAAYTLCYLAGVLGIGALAFQRLELR